MPLHGAARTDLDALLLNSPSSLVTYQVYIHLLQQCGDIRKQSKTNPEPKQWKYMATCWIIVLDNGDSLMQLYDTS